MFSWHVFAQRGRFAYVSMGGGGCHPFDVYSFSVFILLEPVAILLLGVLTW